jgi:hypothetical protein
MIFKVKIKLKDKKTQVKRASIMDDMSRVLCGKKKLG